MWDRRGTTLANRPKAVLRNPLSTTSLFLARTAHADSYSFANATLESRRMDAKELADKFAAKVAAAAVEKDKQNTVAADNNAKRLDDANHCKRAMAEAVIPFLSELKSHLPPNQFSFSLQIDLKDHKVVGVSFRVGDGPATTISTSFGNVFVTRTGDSGSSKGVNFVYPPDAEPYISNSGDLTREKIAKLVEMAIDHS